MPDFKVIQSVNDINLLPQWTDADNFHSINRVVKRSGKRTDATSNAKEYRLVSKKERMFVCHERVARGFLGILVVIASLGTALFSKHIRHLFTKEKMTIRFGIPHQRVPFTKSQLAFYQAIKADLAQHSYKHPYLNYSDQFNPVDRQVVADRLMNDEHVIEGFGIFKRTQKAFFLYEGWYEPKDPQFLSKLLEFTPGYLKNLKDEGFSIQAVKDWVLNQSNYENYKTCFNSEKQLIIYIQNVATAYLIKQLPLEKIQDILHEAQITNPGIEALSECKNFFDDEAKLSGFMGYLNHFHIVYNEYEVRVFLRIKQLSQALFLNQPVR